MLESYTFMQISAKSLQKTKSSIIVEILVLGWAVLQKTVFKLRTILIQTFVVLT